MLSQHERYIYICETSIKTLRDLFHPPSAHTLISSLKTLHDEGKIQAHQYGPRRVSLTKIEIEGSFAKFLFRLSDPSIPDNILENEDDFTLRVSEREEGEAPAVSAHVVVNIASEFDGASAYPTSIENVDYISITVISLYLNTLLTSHFTEERERDGGVKKSKYSPRMDIRGHQSKTVENVLLGGGVLKGMRFETSTATDDGFGEGAYPVIRTSAVFLKVDGSPTGIVALDWANEKYWEMKGLGLQTAKIVIENENGRTKTTKIDVNKDTISENFFILQELLTDFEEPLKACEGEFRSDIVEKMKSKMPN